MPDLILPDHLKKDTAETGVLVYNDENYVIYKKCAQLTPLQSIKVPFDLALIGIGGVNARGLVPLIGKESFLDEVKIFQKAIRTSLKEQKAIAGELSDERLQS